MSVSVASILSVTNATTSGDVQPPKLLELTVTTPIVDSSNSQVLVSVLMNFTDGTVSLSLFFSSARYFLLSQIPFA